MIILLILFEQMSGVCKFALISVFEDIFMVSPQIEEVADSIYHDNARSCFRRHHILCLYPIVLGVRTVKTVIEANSHGKMCLAWQHKCLEHHFLAYIIRKWGIGNGGIGASLWGIFFDRFTTLLKTVVAGKRHLGKHVVGK